MKFTTFLAFALPAFAMAQETDAAEATTTTTMTSTTTLTQTVTLTNVHTTSVYGNGTTAVRPTASATKSSDDSSSSAEPTEEAEDEGNSAAGLDAARVALAGFAGMVIVALM